MGNEQITDDDKKYTEKQFRHFINYLSARKICTGKIAETENGFIYMLKLDQVKWDGCAVQIRFIPGKDVEICCFLKEIADDELPEDFYELLNEINVYSTVGNIYYREGNLLLFNAVRPESALFNPNVVLSYIVDSVKFINDLIIPNVDKALTGGTDKIKEKGSNKTDYYERFVEHLKKNNISIINTEHHTEYGEYFLCEIPVNGLKWNNCTVIITVRPEIDVSFMFILKTVSKEMQEDMYFYQVLNDINVLMSPGVVTLRENVVFYEISDPLSECDPEKIMNLLEISMSGVRGVIYEIDEYEKKLGFINEAVSQPKLNLSKDENELIFRALNGEFNDEDEEYDIRNNDPPKRNGAVIIGNVTADADRYEDEYNNSDDYRWSESEIADYYGYDSSMGISPGEFLDNM